MSVYPYVVPQCALTQRFPSTSPSLAAWPAEGGERGTGAGTTITRLGSYSGFRCTLQMERDFLDCLAWLAGLALWRRVWPSWCDTGGPPSWVPPASSRAQPVPRGLTMWSMALRHHNQA